VLTRSSSILLTSAAAMVSFTRCEDIEKGRRIGEVRRRERDSLAGREINEKDER
jgi:hypothetical protein